MNMDKPINTKEAAEYLGVSAGTLENWRISGGGPKFYKPKGKVFYFKADLESYIRGESK